MRKVIGKVLTISAVPLLLLFILLFMYIWPIFEAHTFRASVSGKITDTEGNPIVGAKVEYCLPNAPGDTIKYDMSSQTDSEGRYSMNLPGFTVALDTSPDYARQVRISADGYAPSGVYAILKKGHNPDGNYILSRRVDTRSAIRPYEASTSNPTAD